MRIWAITCLMMLIGAPSASADWMAQAPVDAAFARFDLNSISTPTLQQKLQIEAINHAVPSHPSLAIAAPAFSLSGLDQDGWSSVTALDCMTAAIYYEAANEPISGQRAVAQVILNRLRHPAFPKNVCGVVFEGSERTTGCQFTFTCDGSLARAPVQGKWLRARAIASAALGGFVEPTVGHATHYHASYVLPYWAGKLTKLTTIGTHIFYQWNGSWSRPSAFNGRYSGHESIPNNARNALFAYLLSVGSTEGLVAESSVTDAVGSSALALQAASEPQRNYSAMTAPAGQVEVLSSNLNVPRPQLIETRSRLKEPPGRIVTDSEKPAPR